MKYDLSAYQLDQTVKTGSIQTFFHNQEMVFVGFQAPLKQWVKKHHHHCFFSKGFNHRNWVNHDFLLGQWLNFKLFGITYLVGKKKFKLLFISGSELAK